MLDRTRFELDGFGLLPSVLAAEACARLIELVETAPPEAAARRRRGGGVYAIRNLFAALPQLRPLTLTSHLMGHIAAIVDEPLWLTRAILFDKHPRANWSVPWHQDTTIAVRQRREVRGFGPWSIKAGVVHVRPPARVLERMLTVRIHLDNCAADTGALQAVPGSHLAGLLDDDAMNACLARTAPVTCACRAGDVLLMRPLLLHASAAGSRDSHRRVIHLEFASQPLPAGLEWASAE